MAVKCTICGEDIAPTDQFCKKCGTELKPSPPATPGQATEPGAPAGTAQPLEGTTPEMGAGAASPRAAKLLFKQFGTLTNEVIPLQGVRMVVGRFDPSTGPVDIDLGGFPGGQHLSRRHAELYWENGCWMVRDLGSTNGVFVRGAGEDTFSARLQEPVELHDGDEIAFGNVTFVFREG